MIKLKENDANLLKQELSKAKPLVELCSAFFELKNWKVLVDEQMIIQKRVLQERDVDAAIKVVSVSELVTNTAFDIDELLCSIYEHASPEQAFSALNSICLSEVCKLQKIILDKGTHADILRLKEWQTVGSNFRFKVLV